MISQWYPPARFVFMPLYRVLRRLMGNKRKAFAALMGISGVLHVGLYFMIGNLIGGNPWPGMLFSSIVFGILTIVVACTKDSPNSDKIADVKKSRVNSP